MLNTFPTEGNFVNWYFHVVYVREKNPHLIFFNSALKTCSPVFTNTTLIHWVQLWIYSFRLSVWDSVVSIVTG